MNLVRDLITNRPCIGRPGIEALPRLLLVGLLMSIGGCVDQSNTVEPQVRNGKACGVTEGAFRSRWWNYYERGQSFAACAMWAEARADLRQALALRARDQRRARTYGMHFVDYFGHRELGIVLYGQGRLEAAIEQLEASLATVKSSKAEVYLDRVRKLLIEKNQLDRVPPDIEIQRPLDGALVTGFSVKVAGVARDDTFVKYLSVNGIPVRIDLGVPRVRFEVEVPLGRLANRIEITVRDIIGRVSTRTLTARSDREGPVLGIEQAAPGGRLKGYIEDASGLDEVKINGAAVALPARGLLSLDQALPPALEQANLLIEAIDRAGNLTTAELDFTDRINRLPGSQWLFASNGPVIGRPGGDDLYLNYRSGQAIFLDQVYLEGRVSMPAGVSSLRVNEIELLARPGRIVYFTHRAALQPGSNTLHITATDRNGRVMRRAIVAQRKIKRLDRRAARYRLAIVGQPNAVPAALSPLWSALQREQRFQLGGSGPIAQTWSADAPRTSAREAADLGMDIADGVLLTDVKQGPDSLEYIGQLVDVPSGEEMLLVDAYQKDGFDPSVLAGTLLDKLRAALPLARGEVMSLSERGVSVRLDDDAVPAGMPAWIYRDQTPRRDPLTGAELGADHQVLGVARIQGGDGYRREAVIEDRQAIKPLRQGDKLQAR